MFEPNDDEPCPGDGISGTENGEEDGEPGFDEPMLPLPDDPMLPTPEFPAPPTPPVPMLPRPDVAPIEPTPEAPGDGGLNTLDCGAPGEVSKNGAEPGPEPEGSAGAGAAGWKMPG